jgi:hypothetical protein
VKSIEDLVSRLRFKPLRITYSSDYFDRLYELVEALVLRELAYVCHCTGETENPATSYPMATSCTGPVFLICRFRRAGSKHSVDWTKPVGAKERLDMLAPTGIDLLPNLWPNFGPCEMESTALKKQLCV